MRHLSMVRLDAASSCDQYVASVLPRRLFHTAYRTFAGALATLSYLGIFIGSLNRCPAIGPKA